MVTVQNKRSNRLGGFEAKTNLLNVDFRLPAENYSLSLFRFLPLPALSKAESRLSKNDTRSGIPAQVYPGGYTRSGTLLLVCSGQTVLDRVHVRSVERDYRLHLVLQEVRL